MNKEKHAKEPAKRERDGTNIAETITDDENLRKVECGILVFADKVITERDADRIVGRLSMTKIDRIYYERQQKAVKEAVEVAVENEQKKSKNEKEEIVIKLLKTGVSESQVSEGTGFSVEEIRALASRV